MSVPAFRNSKSRVRRRRAHHGLKQTGVTKCTKCQAPVLPHRACSVCGAYKDRQVSGGQAEVEKTLDKKVKKSKKEVTVDDQATAKSDQK